MTNKIIARFLNKKDSGSAGTLSSTIGLICNISLAALKMLLGIISHSVAICSDAVNNLSDCASCLITIFGYKLAAKPADPSHPFGHGRIEYMISQAIAVLIIIVGLELLKTSYQRIIDPQALVFSYWVIIGLAVSIAVKLWMGFFNRQLALVSNSTVLQAVSSDSFSDAASTSVTFISYAAAPFLSFPVDGIVGLFVSVLILYGGIKILSNTISEPCSPEKIEKIMDIIAATDGILGVHDLLVHNYGPNKQVGSVHVEVDGYQTVYKAHNIIDKLERELYRQTGVEMVIHMDPVILNNKFYAAAKQNITALLTGIDEAMSFHDFRVLYNPDETWTFDILVPYSLKMSDEQISQILTEALKKDYPKINFEFHFDRNFMG